MGLEKKTREQKRYAQSGALLQLDILLKKVSEAFQVNVALRRCAR